MLFDAARLTILTVSVIAAASAQTVTIRAATLLDGKGDGVVLTALHSRSDSRAYAKPIEAGASPYALTPEEIEAIDRAFKRATVPAR